MAVFEVAIGPGRVPGRFRVEVIVWLAGHPSAVSGRAPRGSLRRPGHAHPTAERLTRTGGDAHLAIDRSAVILPPAMVSLLEESADSRVRSALGRAAPGWQWLFPGASPGRPASAGTILMAWRAAFGSPASLC
jgi:hypothetical protein